MRYDHGSRVNRHRAAFLLRDLKEKLAATGEGIERATTVQAETAIPYWRLSNVAGVHVYRVAEGWHADLAFRNLPRGIPALTGTTVPLGSRREALDSAVRQLVLCRQREGLPLPEDDPACRWFVFDVTEFALDPAYFSEISAGLAAEGYTAEQSDGRLAYLRHLVAGDGPMTADAFDAADEETRRRIVIACEIAMVLGRVQFTPADGTWADYMPTLPGRM